MQTADTSYPNMVGGHDSAGGMDKAESQAGQLARLFGWLDRMRTDHPVWHDRRRDLWHVFPYAEARTVLSDWTTFSIEMMDRIRTPEGLDLFRSGNFSWMDPPRHRELRGLVSRVFTHRMVEGLEPRIRAVITELLNGVDDTEGFEFIEALAHPLPVIVIAELLGVPSQDRALFRRWANILLVGGRGTPRERDADDALRLSDMEPYLREHIERRRRIPEADLISGLVQAEVEGRRLTDQEVIGIAGALLIAGHITTTITLGNAILCLDERPDIATELRGDHALIPQAVEELLRCRPPFTCTPRLTTREAKLAGQSIPSGCLVNVWLASANRDEHEFISPDSFDIHRTPNRHLSFGHGIHFCLGAPLARLEVRIALEMLLSRYQELGLASSAAPEYHRPLTMIGAKRIPIAVSTGR